jgi:hypothetical protein
MVSPMREKRAWPPREKDADAEAVAAFEQTVAVVKETVVRSGEVLVSAKEDLNDHRRWLKVQTAQVEADRERHDRWLQRQREQQEAHERREQKRARRRQMRQAVVQSVTGAIAAIVFAVRSAIWFVVGKTISGLNYIDATAAGALRFVGGKFRDLARYLANAIGRIGLLVGRTAHSLGRSLRALLVAGLGWLGGLIKVAAVGVSGKAHALAPSVGQFLSVSLGGISARTRDAANLIGTRLGAALAALVAKASLLTHRIGEGAAPALSAAAAKGHTIAPALFESLGNAGRAAGTYAKAVALRAQRLLSAKAPPIDAENAVSSSPDTRGFELSQMLMIAGALLLVCGALMLGGGLLLRAGAGSASSAVTAASPSEPIAWLFDHKTLPIDERSVFAYAVTPDGVRIRGFAIGGVNLSDGQVAALDGMVKPDSQAHDLKLTLSVEMPGSPADQEASAQPSEATAAAVPEGTIPSQAPFRLVFLFRSATEGGMTPHEVLAAYGGLMLKVRYEVDGTQRSFIQYLPRALLEEQLAEITAEAKGS